MRKKSLRTMKSAIFQAPESRAEAIMQNILGANNVLVPPEAPFEEILQAILYNTPYTKEAEARIEEILLAIKNNGTYDGEPQSRDEEILISKLNQTPYTKDAESRIEELFILWAAQSIVKQLEGVPPLTFTAIGNPLIAWTIYGNMQQSGTPTPASPVYPIECGELESTGTHAGQYKLPILSGGTTTPVYLGEVQSYRAIKKLVFDGTENWQLYTTTSQRFFYFAISDLGIANKAAICSHTNTATIAQQNRLRIYDNNNMWADENDFKTYLQQQYAAGTPVCVWYVLATPQTTTLNEPLRKIGDYTDSISNVASIPTNNGSNTLDIDTTLKPSNVYIEYQ